jgi:hypothetical protein
MEQFEEFQSPVFIKRSFETGADEAICNYMVEGSALSFTGRLLDGKISACLIYDLAHFIQLKIKHWLSGTLTSQDLLLAEPPNNDAELPKAQIYVFFAKQ